MAQLLFFYFYGRGAERKMSPEHEVVACQKKGNKICRIF